MTTFATVKATCGNCGAISEQQVLSSTNSFGSPDLDLRPPEMQRSTMRMWLQICPSCGYCDFELKKPIAPEITEVVRSDAYQSLLTSEDLPELARRFACVGMLRERSDRLDEAGNALQCAAWACDDASNETAAEQFRKRTATLFDASRARGQEFAGDSGSAAAILVDLWRRAGEFERARAEAAWALETKLEDPVRQVLRYQLELIEAKDRACHTVADALGE